MAVMTSPAMDKQSVEPKPVPSADAMALDANINGSANEHDPLFDEDPAPHHVDIPAPDADAPSDALPTPATNGDDTMNGTDSHLDQDPFADPITDVDSGIAPTAPFLADPLPDAPSLPTAPENLAPTSLPPRVEPATSDVREDPASLPQTSAPDVKPEGATDTPEDFAPAAPAAQSSAPAEDNADKMDVGAQAQSKTEDAPVDAGVTKSDEPTDAVAPPPPADDALQAPATAAAIDTTATAAATATVDHEMPDAPSANKIRPREEDDDDDDDGPLAKRVRTADGSLEPSADGDVKQQPVANAITNGNAPRDLSIAPTSDGAAPGPSTPAPAISNAPEKKKFDSQPLTSAQHKFLMDRLRGAKKTKPAAPFLHPVDPVALNIPHYPQIVTHPMDLSTLETKHKEKHYQSVDAFMDDFYLMIDNCVLFNGVQHPIAQSAWNLQMWFERGMHLLPGREAHPEVPKKPKKTGGSSSSKPQPRRESRANIPVHSPTNSTSNNATFALQADGTPLIRRDSSTGDGRPKREIHRPPPKDLPYSNPRPKNKKSQLELKFAETVITEMLKPKYRDFSYPFLQPVDPVALNIPQYLKIIKKPMDLGTVQSRLKHGEYASAKDVKADMDLIFANCFKFNPEGDDVNKMGHMLEDVYKRAWERKAEWMEEHAPASEPVSDASDVESEEDEEEDDEEEIRQRQAQIAEQIMRLTQEQLALQNKKGKSPKVAVSKKSSKKDKSQAKSKKSSKLSAPTKPKKKQRQITFEEKRLISETIGNLDEVQMAKAVQIIRNGVPALQGVNDDELELDIDTIPNDVLHDLLKYIKTVNPAATAAAAAVTTYDDDYEPPSRKNTATQPRKNKPMGKHEQEQAIAEIKQRLQNFTNRGSSSDQSPEPATAHRDESSDDESSASESEEE